MNGWKKTVIVGLLFTALMGCGSSSDSVDNFVQSGKDLVAEGKLKEARLEFKNALQIDPRATEPFYQLALIDEKEQNWAEMYKNLLTVYQLDPTRADATLYIGKLLLLGNKLDDALEKANLILDADNSNVQAMILRASIEMRQKNYKLAMTDLDKVISITPENVEAKSLKALTLNLDGKPQEALSEIDEALKVAKEPLALIKVKVSILESNEMYAEAEKLYRELLVQKNVDEDTYQWATVALAKLLNNDNRYEEAKGVLKSYLSAHPDDKQFQLLLVSLVKKKEPEVAISLLDKNIKDDPKAYELRFMKAKLELDLGHIDDSVATLNKIVKLDSNGPAGRKAKIILAKHDLNEERVEQARTRVDEVLADEPENAEALFLKAGFEISDEQYDAAINHLRMVIRNNNNADDAIVLMAEAYFKSGSVELGEKTLRDALIVNPGNVTAALYIAKKLIEKKDYAGSEDILVKALDKQPKNEGLLETLVRVRLLKGDWDGSKQLINTLADGKEVSAPMHMLKGQIAQEQGLYDSAIKEFEAALSMQPDMPLALQGLIASYMQQNKVELAVNYLSDVIKRNPDSTQAYGLMASIYNKTGEFEKAISILEKGIEKAPTWENGYSAIATNYLALNKSDKAIDAYEQGIKKNPTSIGLPIQLAVLHEKQADYSKAKAIYEGVLLKNPDVKPAINNLASILTDHFATDEDLAKAGTLTKVFKDSTNPYYLDSYGWAQLHLGNYDNAQTALDYVNHLAPKVAIFNYHAGVMYVKLDKKEEAKTYLNKAILFAEEQGEPALAEKAKKLLESL